MAKNIVVSKSHSVLLPDAVEKTKEIGGADIIVGIPSYENADTIQKVIEMASKGLAQYFPRLRAVIVNSDGSPDDSTRIAAEKTDVAPHIRKIVTQYQGLSGKGTAFHAIFEVADRLGAKTCIMVDSDVRSITPDWIRLLGEPIHKHNYGFVTPMYARHKFDGTITNALAYPLMCALYGQSIRQPIGGEFAMSGALAKILSHQNVWESDIAKFGVDIWMTTTAVCEGFSVCQANMGAKVHDEKDPGADLGPMFREVVGTIFNLMKKYEIKWPIITGCRRVKLFGDYPDHTTESIDIDLDRLSSTFREKFIRDEQLLPDIISKGDWSRLKKLNLNLDGQALLFPNRLWARIVYDHAVAYRFNPDIEKEEVLSSLLTMFLGRTAGFVNEARTMTDSQVEDRVHKAAAAFRMEKPYLVKKWAAAARPLVTR